MDVGLMIEGQDGLDWPRWKALARVAEEGGFAGLFRSDHFVNPGGPSLAALDLWTSQAWLAATTERIEFGPLVSPVSFRHPVTTAWTAAAVDDLSGGRLRLGLGAGWQEREHNAFGFDLLDTDRRFARFQEGLEVITRLLRSDEPVSFAGEFYQLRDAQLMPRPTRPGGPPIVIGGNGKRRTLPLAAGYADEWNGVFLSPEQFAETSQALNQLLAAAGRPASAVKRTLMVRAVYGADRAAAERKLAGQLAAELEARGAIIGGLDAVQERLASFAAVGVEQLMLQWVDDLDDLAGIEALARAAIG